MDVEKQRQQANLHQKLLERKKRRQEAQQRKQEREMAKELLEQKKELAEVRTQHVSSSVIKKLGNRTSLNSRFFIMIREFKNTTTATGTSLNKRFNEQNYGSARAL